MRLKIPSAKVFRPFCPGYSEIRALSSGPVRFPKRRAIDLPGAPQPVAVEVRLKSLILMCFVIHYHDDVMAWKRIPYHWPSGSAIKQPVMRCSYYHYHCISYFDVVSKNKHSTKSWVAGDLWRHDVHVMPLLCTGHPLLLLPKWWVLWEPCIVRMANSPLRLQRLSHSDSLNMHHGG